MNARSKLRAEAFLMLTHTTEGASLAPTTAGLSRPGPRKRYRRTYS